ncbi:MAG: selenoneine synthase SenA [Burkholderiaceae bacterium]
MRQLPLLAAASAGVTIKTLGLRALGRFCIVLIWSSAQLCRWRRGRPGGPAVLQPKQSEVIHQPRGGLVRRANREQLTGILLRTRERFWAMFEHLDDDNARVPILDIVNPPLWEIGHVAWFQEFWCLRNGSFERPCLRPDGDRLYDSARIAHADRWSLPLPDLAGTRAYVDEVQVRSLERLAAAADDDHGLYFHRLSVAHEMMHIEAFAYTWQTLGYQRPSIEGIGPAAVAASSAPLAMAGGEVEVGSRPDDGFVFDNEQWAHSVAVDPFRIDPVPVSNGRYLAFVNDGGYRNNAWWSDAGRQWLARVGRDLPRYWRRDSEGMFERRHRDWAPLDTSRPIAHVSAYEAEAFARWDGGRLPSEPEWLMAAGQAPAFVWGESVWEWTSTPFAPLRGFEPGAYREYSQPWFHDHRVVRGGSFVTPRELVDARFRNFYKPHRDDPYLGFRVAREPA